MHALSCHFDTCGPGVAQSVSGCPNSVEADPEPAPKPGLTLQRPGVGIGFGALRGLSAAGGTDCWIADRMQFDSATKPVLGSIFFVWSRDLGNPGQTETLPDRDQTCL